MTLKKIIIASMVVAFAAFMVVPAMATSFATWQGVAASSETSKNSQTSTLSVTATDNVPHHTDVLGGFAWIYGSGPDTAFVVVTHNGVRDSGQNPDGWHVHNVDLGGGAPSVSNACIAFVSPDTTAGISIHGNTINVNVPNSKLTGTFTGQVAAFSIVADSGCGSGLGVVLAP